MQFLTHVIMGVYDRTYSLAMYVTPCHFLLYSSNAIVTLTEETNRSSHSDTKKLDHYKSNEVFLISATNGNKRHNLMRNKILYNRSLPSVTCMFEHQLPMFEYCWCLKCDSNIGHSNSIESKEKIIKTDKKESIRQLHLQSG